MTFYFKACELLKKSISFKFSFEHCLLNNKYDSIDWLKDVDYTHSDSVKNKHVPIYWLLQILYFSD